MSDIDRLRNFHGACGARIFTGYVAGEPAPRYFASDAPNAAEIAVCPACGERLMISVEVLTSAGSDSGAGVYHRRRSTVLTAHEMEQRWLAARERLCAGAALDAEALVCMGAEMEEGLSLEEIAPLYGRTAEDLRAEIATFSEPTANPEPQPILP